MKVVLKELTNFGHFFARDKNGTKIKLTNTACQNGICFTKMFVNDVLIYTSDNYTYTMAIWTGPDEIFVGENYSYLDGEIKKIDFSFYE